MTLADLETAMLAAATKPLQIKNGDLFVRQHSLKDLVELHDHLTAISAMDAAAAQAAAGQAVIPGIRLNRFDPAGTV